MRKLLRDLIMGALIAGMLSACTATPRVAVIRDPAADFSGYRSFTFHQPLGTDRESGTGTLLSQQLMNTTKLKLEALGYRFHQEKADLEVNFFVETREVVRGHRGPSVGVGYGVYHRNYGVWSGYETEIRQYTESTLHVDVVDTGRNQLIWEGVATERLTQHDIAFESENIPASLGQIFAGFPRAVDLDDAP